MKTSNFKLIKTIVLTLLLNLTLVNCSEEYLAPKPLSIFTPESAFVDARAMYAVLSNCNLAIRDQFYGDGTPMMTELIFSEVCIYGQDNRMGPATDMNISITPTSELNNNRYNRIGWFWTEFYKIIKDVNVVISSIDGTKFTNESERNAVLGSAYFYRSYCYYRLTQQFGDVPFIGKAVAEPKLDFYSTKREVILDKIKKDMEFAAKWCSDNVERGRVTKGAAGHLLTQINLALGKFDDAIASSSAVINGGTYSLMRQGFGAIPAEAGNFLKNLGVVRDDVVARLHWYNNKALPANKEVLYMVISRPELLESRARLNTMRVMSPFWSNSSSFMIYTPDGKGPATSAVLGQPIQLVETFGRGYGDARGTNYHQRLIWDDQNDLRHKKYNWMKPEYLVYNNTGLNGKSPYYGKNFEFRGPKGNILTTDTIMNWFEWPHYKAYVPDPENTQVNGGYADWYVYRLAETYLLRAEAYWWKGDQANAMADINAVRTRALCAPYMDASKIDIGTVLDERARELFYEEMRKTELNRISFLFAKTGKSYKGKTYSMTDFGTKNFFYDRVMEKNDFYNKGVINVSGVEFKMSPYHVLFPVPQTAISSNSQGVINQNFGYDGFAKNMPPLAKIDAKDDN
jgi:hypothetical protein